MAIRELIYFVNLIMRMVHEKKINIYGHKKIKIPRPQIELICEAININPNKNTGLKKKSYVLEDFFRQRGDEVKKMTVLDFTFERRIELEKRDARAEGETIGEAIGKSKSVLELLAELGEISPKLKEQILNQKDDVTLSRWLKCAAKAENIADFEKRIINE